MFEVTEQSATLSSISIGSELHGEDPVPACYIDLTMETGAEILDLFCKGLRSAFYARPNPKQQPLDGVEEASGPRLKFDGVLGPLKLKLECVGYTARIEWGDLASSVKVTLGDATIKKFKAEPKNGGSCALSFQVQAHPTKEDYGELAMLQRRDVRLWLDAPKADATVGDQQQDGAGADAGAGGELGAPGEGGDSTGDGEGKK
jgi:hypothetical protein